MSKFLKFIVNTVLIAAIVVAGGLLIPPFAGVTTVIVDDLDMDTNLEEGSVCYAVTASSAEISSGDRILVSVGEQKYVYEISAIDGEQYQLEDRLSTDGGSTSMNLGDTVKKVVLILPYIGYASMALRSTEGLIIVALSIIFLIILFILAEIWGKEDEEEEEEEDEGQAEEEPLSRREQKRAAKAEKKAAKAARKAEKKAAKAAKRAGTADMPEQQEEQPAAPAGGYREQPAFPEAAAAVPGDMGALPDEDALEPEPAPAAPEAADGAQELFAETESMFAADIASMMQGMDPVSGVRDISADGAQAEGTGESEKTGEPEAGGEAAGEPEQNAPKKLAMPVYTREELMEKIRLSDEEPKIVEDEISGVTLFDYSDIL